MKAAEKMAKRVELHQKLTNIDGQIEGRITRSSRLVSLHDLLRLRERACAEMQSAGFAPWTSPYASKGIQ